MELPLELIPRRTMLSPAPVVRLKIRSSTCCWLAADMARMTFVRPNAWEKPNPSIGWWATEPSMVAVVAAAATGWPTAAAQHSADATTASRRRTHRMVVPLLVSS